VIMEPPTWASCGCAGMAWSVLAAVWVMGGLLVAAFPGVAILGGRVVRLAAILCRCYTAY
jgi:hypothetical protein